VLFAELFDAWGRRLARVNDFADIERHIHFPPCRLHMDYEGDGRLRITTDRFARSVELSGLSDEGDAFGWRFEDNFFDLLPCESRTVRILGPARRGQVTAKGFFSDHATTVEVF
jgi:hypothetical protein